MLRSRITVSLDPALVQAADSLVDGAVVRNRSHAFEVLMRQGLGLSELTTLIILAQPDWQPAQLTQLASLTKQVPLETLYWVASADLPGRSDLSFSISTEFPTLKADSLPGEFGDGGALSLLKGKLTQPALLIWLSTDLQLPSSLLPAYAFHRQHHSTLTDLVQPNNTSYTRLGVSIAKPELCDAIPAGRSDLLPDVFPVLSKQGRVRAYVY
jgi:hypothetical protein